MHIAWGHKRAALVYFQIEILLHDFPPKVTTEAQLGLIGGTMGLLTGFSILSGVEIVYYLLRLLPFLVPSVG